MGLRLTRVRDGPLAGESKLYGPVAIEIKELGGTYTGSLKNPLPRSSISSVTASPSTKSS